MGGNIWLFSDNRSKYWITIYVVEDSNDDEKEGVENNILQPRRCTRNARVEIRDLKKNYFVLDDMENEKDEE